MKRHILKILCSIEVCALVVGLQMTASAYSCGEKLDGYVCCGSYHTFGHGRYLPTLWGTRHGVRFYKIGEGFSDSEETTISNAISVWNNRLKSGGVYQYFNLSKEGNSPQVIIKPSILENGIYGRTRFYSTGGMISVDSTTGMLSSGYTTVEIYIDSAKGKLKKVAEHEIGHSMGLSHRLCTTKSIMHNYVDAIEFTAPQDIDVATVYHTYC